MDRRLQDLLTTLEIYASSGISIRSDDDGLVIVQDDKVVWMGAYAPGVGYERDLWREEMGNYTPQPESEDGLPIQGHVDQHRIIVGEVIPLARSAWGVYRGKLVGPLTDPVPGILCKEHKMRRVTDRHNHPTPWLYCLECGATTEWEGE